MLHLCYHVDLKCLRMKPVSVMSSSLVNLSSWIHYKLLWSVYRVRCHNINCDWIIIVTMWTKQPISEAILQVDIAIFITSFIF